MGTSFSELLKRAIEANCIKSKPRTTITIQKPELNRKIVLSWNQDLPMEELQKLFAGVKVRIRKLDEEKGK